MNDYIKFEAATNTLSMMTAAILLKVRHVVRRSMHFGTIHIKQYKGQLILPTSNQTKTKVKQHECSMSTRKSDALE